MESLNIAGTADTPSILLDSASGEFKVEGKSMPEDVASFYQPILQWLEGYGESPAGTTVVDFKLIYFNTASSKMLMDIMIKLEEIMEDGNEVKIKWYFQEDDEDMEEAGEEYADIVEVDFEYISYV